MSDLLRSWNYTFSSVDEVKDEREGTCTNKHETTSVHISSQEHHYVRHTLPPCVDATWRGSLLFAHSWSTTFFFCTSSGVQNSLNINAVSSRFLSTALPLPAVATHQLQLPPPLLLYSVAGRFASFRFFTGSGG